MTLKSKMFIPVIESKEMDGKISKPTSSKTRHRASVSLNIVSGHCGRGDVVFGL